MKHLTLYSLTGDHHVAVYSLSDIMQITFQPAKEFMSRADIVGNQISGNDIIMRIFFMDDTDKSFRATDWAMTFD